MCGNLHGLAPFDRALSESVKIGSVSCMSETLSDAQKRLIRDQVRRRYAEQGVEVVILEGLRPPSLLVRLRNVVRAILGEN